MKKLLGLLGALSLTTSATATAVACGTEEKSSPKYQDVAIQKVLGEYSKALFVSQQGVNGTHVNSNYIFNNIIGEKSLKELGLDSKSTEKFSETIKKQLDVNNFTSKVEASGVHYSDGTVSLDSQVNGTIGGLLKQLPTIFGILENPQSLGTNLGNILNVIDINSLLSKDLLEKLESGLSEKNVILLRNAFSNDIYKDMNYYDATNSSIIGLANALQNLTAKSPKILNYENTHAVYDNYVIATKNLATSIMEIIKGKVSFNTDLNKIIPAVAEIIRFIRTLLIYIDSYSYEELTTSVLTQQVINEKRMSKVVNNVIDMKKLLKVFTYMLNEDEKATVLKNLVGALFSTTKVDMGANEDVEAIMSSTNFETNTHEGGLAGILVQIIINSEGSETISVETGIFGTLKIHYSHILRGLLNYISFGKNSGGVAFMLVMLNTFAATLPDFLKNFVNNFDNDTWPEFAKDPLGYLWKNNNKKLNFQLKEALNKPLSELTSMFNFSGETKKAFDEVVSSGSDFLTDKSLKTIVNDLSKSLEKYEEVKLDFDLFKNLLNNAHENKFFENFFKNPNNWVKLIGVEGSNIKENSVISDLTIIVKNNPWLVDVISVFNNYISKNNKELKQIKTDVIESLKKVKIEEEGFDGSVYSYVVTDGVIKKTFNIKLADVDSKKVISAISFVS